MISIITIFLNRDRFIAEAIESVLSQTCQDWELLLVDDGSTDRATAIAKNFAARYPEKIRYFEHPGHANLGMGASRNLGLTHARGEYVSYLDADDVWRPDKLADQIGLLRQSPRAAFVYGPLELWRSWTKRPSDVDEIQQLGLAADRVVEPPELLKVFLRNPENNPSGILVRWDILAQKGGYDPSFKGMYEDLVVTAKICLSEPVHVASKSWYRYRQHSDSCNARAWRTGRDRETRLRYLRWLDGYLVEVGVVDVELCEIVQEQIRALDPTLLRKLPDFLYRQTLRAKRVTQRVIKKMRRTLGTPPVILCYHRVLKPENDPHLLAVSPENFRQQLEVIRRIAGPLGLGALADGNRPSRGVVLTFDDGYLDNLENALPLLREFAMPATIYIATGYVGVEREFWWDDLERLILGPSALPEIVRLQVNGRPREWSLAGENGHPVGGWNVLATGERTPRQKFFVGLHAALRPLSEAQQQDVLQQLRALAQVSPAPRPLYRCMNAAELKSLAAEPLLTLGAHTITHCDLDYRTALEQSTEINGSRQQLEQIIGREVVHFSYPYGSFNRDAVQVCRRGKFRSAVTCLEGGVERGTAGHRLPRFLVRDWDGPEFEQRLRHFFCG